MFHVLRPANPVVSELDYKYQLTCQMLLSSGPVALIMPLLILSVQTSQSQGQTDLVRQNKNLIFLKKRIVFTAISIFLLLFGNILG